MTILSTDCWACLRVCLDMLGDHGQHRYQGASACACYRYGVLSMCKCHSTPGILGPSAASLRTADMTSHSLTAMLCGISSPPVTAAG